jgi:peptidoglycan glycosyltransferase
MDEVTQPFGTAYGMDVPGVPYGGKTGTVETGGGNGPNTTWFTAYAPSKNPQIAIAVYMEQTGGYGAEVAAPVARDIIRDALTPAPKPKASAPPPR